MELFKQAANAYKLSKSWQEAGTAFLRVSVVTMRTICRSCTNTPPRLLCTQQADCYLQLGSKHEAASAFQNAATCFEKCNIPEAIAALTRSVEFYVDEGRFGMAAKQEQQIGEMLEVRAVIVCEMWTCLTHICARTPTGRGQHRCVAAASADCGRLL